MPGPVRDPAEAFQQLEAIMLRQMLQSSGAFKASSTPGAQLRTDMFVETLADAVAKAGGLGIAKMLDRQLGGAAGTPGAGAPPAPADHHRPLRGSPVGATLEHVGGSAAGRSVPSVDDLDDPNSDAPLPEDPTAASIDDYQAAPGATRQRHGGAGYTPAAMQGVTHPHAPEISGEITSAFGQRIHPITGDRRFHTGVDVRAPEGAPIRAAAGGVVLDAGRRGGYGNTVEIDHGNGTKTLYAHASTVLVSKGQHVDPGQPIALVGQTGQATGPHLHFEIRRNDHPVNPLSGHAPISITRALNRYRERVEVTGAGTTSRVGSGDEP